MRGWAAMNQWLQQLPTKDNLVAVRAWFDRALEIDPNDADALAGEANTTSGKGRIELSGMSVRGDPGKRPAPDFDCPPLPWLQPAFASLKPATNSCSLSAFFTRPL
jgi:hypothetical protein